MPKRALYEKRPFLLASIAAAAAYYLLRDGATPGLYLALLKAAGVGLLAVYALVRHKGADAKHIALVMLLAAAGDGVLEFDWNVGGFLFFASQLVALGLYLKPQHRRHHLTPSQKYAAVALLLGTPAIVWLLTQGTAPLFYGLALGGMAGAAWTSRFSRYHVGIGALLFVASDLALFAPQFDPALAEISRWLVWPLYYVGQFLICTGVIQTLRRDHEV